VSQAWDRGRTLAVRFRAVKFGDALIVPLRDGRAVVALPGGYSRTVNLQDPEADVDVMVALLEAALRRETPQEVETAGEARRVSERHVGYYVRAGPYKLYVEDLSLLSQ